MQEIREFLADPELALETSTDGSSDYVHPARKNAGSIALVVLREAIAPFVARNADEEITDIAIGDSLHVRAVPAKFKYAERQRGLLILRALDAGGSQPQNRTAFRRNDKPSDRFDLNTLVFGDSANHENRVLPVKAAVNYSDALSLLPKEQCVGTSFHNRASETGTLFDEVSKRNSENLFNRHFVLPGTLLLQVLSSNGRVLPPEGLDHLLLALGLAGSYGGQTSVTGTNIRTHIVGLYAGRYERPEASPYVLLDRLRTSEGRFDDIVAVTAALRTILSSTYERPLDGAAIIEHQRRLLASFEQDDHELRARYAQTKSRVGRLFDAWFTGR